MQYRLRRLPARFIALLRADASGVRAGFVALVVSSITGLVAGVILANNTDTLERRPGLLLLVPAAVGMRGNVFGALSSRLGTAVHMGTFRISKRLDTDVGQNLGASVLLSVSLSLILGVAAKGFAVVFGVANAISLSDFIVVSVVGGLIPIAVVMAITIGVSALSARRGWDLDNVAAPIVTAAADSITLPSLILATVLIGRSWVTPMLAIASTVVGVAALLGGLRARRYPLLQRIVQESTPVLVLSGLISLLAGKVEQAGLEPLLKYEILLLLLPPLLSISGSLAGIFSCRLGSKLHLGMVDPRRRSLSAILDDILFVYLLALSIFMLLGATTAVVGMQFQFEGLSVIVVVAISLLAGLLATTFTNVVAYFTAFATYRYSLDPDNFGIPITAAFSDFLGAVSFVLVITLFQLS